MDEIKNGCKEFVKTAVSKFKELKDQAEIGKCIRSIVIATGVGFSIHTLVKGGINYNDKLQIGTNKPSKNSDFMDQLSKMVKK